MKPILFLVAAIAACAQIGCALNPDISATVLEAAEGEEKGLDLAIDATHDSVRVGVRLILRYDQDSEGFIGTVDNVSDKTIEAVRVEVHLSNGTELGPTPRERLAPKQKRNVELSATGQTFETWKAHTESDAGEEHGHDSEGEGEHGRERDESREHG
ncbi:MAG: hypothetical protein GWQ05_21670 [Verrucomicrobiaceae bacterium]|nr:hypothetical protein [Verrucomicrobiaceae bacterium]NCF93539.1 hypothetical protein [Verrucomicrobiaceae bacterium]